MSEKIVLIRDASEISENAENFLIENHYTYNVYYSERKNNLPLIYASRSYMPYEGEHGLHIFKQSHKRDYLFEE